jgi:hypothetical protein
MLESAQPGAVPSSSSSLPPIQNRAGPLVEDTTTHSIFHADPAQSRELAHPRAEAANTRSWRERFLDGAIKVNEFASIIADVSEITKPLKVACEGLNYILKNTRVRSSL